MNEEIMQSKEETGSHGRKGVYDLLSALILTYLSISRNTSVFLGLWSLQDGVSSPTKYPFMSHSPSSFQMQVSQVSLMCSPPCMGLVVLPMQSLR